MCVIVVGLARRSTDLWKQEINPKGTIFIVEIFLQVGNGFSQKFGGVANATNDTQTTRIGDGGREFWTSNTVHTCE